MTNELELKLTGNPFIDSGIFALNLHTIFLWKIWSNAVENRLTVYEIIRQSNSRNVKNENNET